MVVDEAPKFVVKNEEIGVDGATTEVKVAMLITEVSKLVSWSMVSVAVAIMVSIDSMCSLVRSCSSDESA